ncbi:MerR family transcriptional regulator [Myceligenerans pegani]|uniref:MerR family transcriptional regulator n=1 Tax=Myceligenerans pegani TaxID=2776917 RepID=A0ABR9N647_9MICO|nr:MerR family transcriptional regulator [Myceligenerans sp. TRM 65318]MBE1878845.1 MerR family transcriptional regulator [Myceligenerans sp. TRM 65318]MBE3021116.1 MerR family transcriptional regulator [Myceligenerans sp. TRM 65318]
MRISELSERSGVSPASIKYYIREGLLPGGERTGYNSTEYDESHVGRLRLIRALIDTGGLTVAAARKVIGAIDDPGISLDHVLGIAQQAMPESAEPPSDIALDRVRAVMRERGWSTVAENPGITLAATALDDFAATGRTDLTALLSRYAAAIDLIAEADLDFVAARGGDRDQAAETVVVGIALGDVLLAGLRRIAQESLTHRRYRGGVVPSDRKEPS